MSLLWFDGKGVAHFNIITVAMIMIIHEYSQKIINQYAMNCYYQGPACLMVTEIISTKNIANQSHHTRDLPLPLPLAFRFLLSSIVGALHRSPWPFLNIIDGEKKEKK